MRRLAETESEASKESSLTDENSLGIRLSRWKEALLPGQTVELTFNTFEQRLEDLRLLKAMLFSRYIF